MSVLSTPAPDNDPIDDLVRRALAQRHLWDFAQRVVHGFMDAKHIRFLCEVLERVERHEIKRLIIVAPPGFGKSTLLQAFIAWFLGRNPRRRSLLLSANEGLAVRNSRVVRGYVQDSSTWPFPDVRLSEDSTAVATWGTKDGGGVKALGAEGIVTGHRAEAIICDDVQPDVMSPTTLQNLEDWFRSVLTTRLEPNGVAVVIQTRWSENDIVARLREGESGDQWTFVNLPAIAEPGDVLGRDVGESLWPERWPVELLAERKIEVGSYTFQSAYQGHPTPAGGVLFAAEWLAHTYDAIPTHRVDGGYPAIGLTPDEIIQRQIDASAGRSTERRPPLVILAIDTAASTSKHRDRSAIVSLVGDGRDVYIESVYAARLGYVDLRKAVIEQYQLHRPRVVYIEAAQSGFALIDELKRSTRIPIVGVVPTLSKEGRAQLTLGWFEAGRIKFPKHASWLSEALQEFAAFPGGAHDDIVDSTIMGIIQLQSDIAREENRRRFLRQVKNAPNWFVR